MGTLNRMMQFRDESAEFFVFATEIFCALFAGILLLAGVLVFAFGGIWGSLLLSPIAPSIGAVGIIRIVGIALFSIGVAFWPSQPRRRGRRLDGLAVHCGLSLLYLFVLALEFWVLDGKWPEPPIISLTVLHFGALLVIGPLWLRRRNKRRRY